MTKRWTWMALLLLAMAALWGCSDDDDPVTPTQTAFEKMADAVVEYINDSTDAPGVISAAALAADLDNYVVVDIRAPQDYLNGHIPGAINASLTNLMGDLAAKAVSTSDNIVVVCYSGQSAGHAKVALELMGYENVKTLGFGMCSWTSELSGAWDNNVGNALATPETTNNNGQLTTHDFPSLSEDVDTVVADRVNAVLAEGFKGINYSDMVTNGLENYFIINYFSEADYLGQGTSGVPGHIPGAYQFTPYQSLGMDQMLANLPTDMPIVVYCWTGQHSSQVTFALNLLGYEAYSLKWGSNGLFYDNLTAHKWATPTTDLALEMGSQPTAAFQALVDAGIAYINDSGDCPGVINADDIVANGVANYKIFDIRDANAYDAGHIEGAINAPPVDGDLSACVDVITANATMTDPIVVACYTGQSAGHVKVALELLGYENVKSLLFGMASWNTSLAGSWTNNCADNLATPSTVNENENLDTVHAYPEPTGTLAERVEATLAAGFKGISYTDMVNNGLENYFIVNYFGEADYLGNGMSGVPGHIPGAYQFTPYASLDIDQMLMYLPTDMPVVVYCWTGQHSSQVTAYLNMLGYDAYSLKFGSNNLFHSSLTGHKWTEAGGSNDYPLVTD